MATPQEKLANSLEALRELQSRGLVAIQSRDLSRTNRERLVKNAFLSEVMKGWYVPAELGRAKGDSTSWYTSFWAFAGAYLSERFGADWCLSPEQSLLLHAGNWSVPTLLHVRAPKGGNKLTDLPHGTSLMDARYPLPDPAETTEIRGLRLYSIPAGLIKCTEPFFRQAPTDVRAVLSTVKDPSDILRVLLAGGHSTIAGRLVGAFRNIGNERIADSIKKTMESADYVIKELDPFQDHIEIGLANNRSTPQVNRLKLMWSSMRLSVLDTFPAEPGRPNDSGNFIKSVDDAYVSDAYHSLSIEGYRVNADLIERVKSGDWNPGGNEDDRHRRDAMAASGYHKAFDSVQHGLERVLSGNNPGDVADEEHGDWYRELFAPSISAGIIDAADLAGYRNGPVFINQSKHIPPSSEAVRELMPTFFDLLRQETEASVRAVLGHFTFVYIHPYVDGNGRMGRFLMNVMLASGGYPWTIIPVGRRDEYMAALEAASVDQNIKPFSEFLAGLVADRLAGETTPSVPQQ